MLLTTVIDGLVVAFFSFLFMCAYFFGAPFFWTFFFWLWRDQLHLMELLSYIVKVTLHIVKSKNRWCNLVDRTVHFVSLVPWWSSLTIFSNLGQFASFFKVAKISTSLTFDHLFWMHFSPSNLCTFEPLVFLLLCQAMVETLWIQVPQQAIVSYLGEVQFCPHRLPWT